MSRFEYDDKLELYGILVGVFVVLYSVLMLAGMPWATNESVLAVIIQMIGILIAIGIGLGLIWAVYSGETDDLIPGR